MSLNSEQLIIDEIRIKMKNPIKTTKDCFIARKKPLVISLNRGNKRNNLKNLNTLSSLIIKR